MLDFGVAPTGRLGAWESPVMLIGCGCGVPSFLMGGGGK